MGLSFNGSFYRNPLFYLFLFNLILFFKDGLFQRSIWITVLAVSVLLLQLFMALTEQVPERKRNIWLVVIFLLLSLFMLWGCSSNKKVTVASASEGSSLVEGAADNKSDSAIRYQDIVSNYQHLTTEQILAGDFSKNSLVFLGRVSCPHCRDFLPFFRKQYRN